MTQHRQHHYHRHRHRMEIVLENPSLAARTPVSSIATTTTTSSQLDHPLYPPLHLPHHTLYDVGTPLLPAECYYTRNCHGMASYGDLNSTAAPVTVRRVDKSGLLEIAETDPMVCPRPCVLTGAESVVTRTPSLRVDRSGLLEAVPEAVDQLEEHSNGDVSVDCETVTTHTLTTVTTATTTMGDEIEGIQRGEMLKTVAAINSRIFDGDCLLQRPLSLEGQACTGEIDARSRVTDVKLPHLSLSPKSSPRCSRSDTSRTSPLAGRCTDVDYLRLRNQKSPQFPTKYISGNSNPSQGLTLTLDYSSATPVFTSSMATSTLASPPIRGRLQVGCSKDNFDAALIKSDDPAAVDTIKAHRESLLVKGTAEQENDLPGEERAEAEGCEHTTAEGLEGDEISFKGSNKLLDNDNVQTLRVIILSEQL